MDNLIPTDKHKKIIGGAKYFYRLKPSDMNFTEHQKLMKFCKYIMGEESTPERQYSIEEMGQIITTGELPGQMPLPKINDGEVRISQQRLIE